MPLWRPRNLNYWDSVSTLAGEVQDPHKTFPRALGGAPGGASGAWVWLLCWLRGAVFIGC